MVEAETLDRLKMDLADGDVAVEDLGCFLGEDVFQLVRQEDVIDIEESDGEEHHQREQDEDRLLFHASVLYRKEKQASIGVLEDRGLQKNKRRVILRACNLKYFVVERTTQTPSNKSAYN